MSTSERTRPDPSGAGCHIREAVRASVLSKRWRHLGCQTSGLFLDASYVPPRDRVGDSENAMHPPPHFPFSPLFSSRGGLAKSSPAPSFVMSFTGAPGGAAAAAAPQQYFCRQCNRTVTLTTSPGAKIPCPIAMAATSRSSTSPTLTLIPSSPSNPPTPSSSPPPPSPSSSPLPPPALPASTSATLATSLAFFDSDAFPAPSICWFSSMATSSNSFLAAPTSRLSSGRPRLRRQPRRLRHRLRPQATHPAARRERRPQPLWRTTGGQVCHCLPAGRLGILPSPHLSFPDSKLYNLFSHQLDRLGTISRDASSLPPAPTLPNQAKKLGTFRLPFPLVL